MNPALQEISKKVAAATVAGAATPVVAAKEFTTSSLRPIMEMINPLNYAKVVINQVDHSLGLSSLRASFDKIYSKLYRNESDSGQARRIPVTDESAEKVAKKTGQNQKTLSLILDVLIDTYKLQVDSLQDSAREEALSKLKGLEDQRESARKPFSNTIPKITAKDPGQISRFTAMIGALPGWFIKTLGAGASLTVAGLAHYFGFDVIIHMFEQISGVTKGLLGGVLKPILGHSKTVATIFEKLVSPFSKIAKLTSGLMKPVVGILSPLVKVSSGLARFFKFIGGPFLLTFMALFDFTKGFIDGYENGGILEGVKRGLLRVVDAMVWEPLELLKKISSFLIAKMGFENFSRLLDSFNVKELVYSIVQTGYTTVTKAFYQLRDSVLKASLDTSTFVQDTISSISQFASSTWKNRIVKPFETTKESMMKYASGIEETLSSFGISMLQKAKDFSLKMKSISLTKYFNDLWSNIQDVLKSSFDWLSSVFSPSKLTGWLKDKWTDSSRAVQSSLGLDTTTNNQSVARVVDQPKARVNEQPLNTITNSSSMAVHNNTVGGSSLNVFDQKQIYYGSTGSSTSNDGNATRNIPVSTTPPRSPWESREVGSGW